MNDLGLWDILDASSTLAAASGPEVLRALLDELAGLPLAERWPFFGRIGSALEHPSAAVRTAAVKAMAGAGGFLGFRAIVRALDDADPATRAAAAASLGASAASDADRWAHAAFHRLADVRRAALAHPPGGDLPWYALLLSADPACREAVLARRPDKAAPPSAVHALIDLSRGGHLPRETAADLVADVPVEDLYEQLRRGAAWRSDQAVADLLAAAAGRATPAVEALRSDPHADGLDDLLDLFWDGGAAMTRAVTSGRSARERFFERWTTWLIDGSRRGPAERVRCAALRAAARAGAWDPLAAELALVIDPAFLQLKWVEPAVRAASVRGLYRYASRLDPLPPDRVTALLTSPPCRRPDGLLDLWVVGGLLRWAGGEPYTLAAKVLGAGEIVAAFLADPAGSAPMFAAGRDPEGRKQLLALIAQRARHTVGSIVAGLVLVSAADELEFLDDLDGPATVTIYAELLEMCRRPGAALSDNKVRRLADVLAAKVEPEHLGEYLRATADAPEAETSPLVLRLLSAVARLAGADKWTAAARRLDPARLTRVLGLVHAAPGFPYGVEAALAHALARHKDEAVRAWAAARAATGAAPVASASLPTVAVRKLDAAASARIATCATADLSAAVEPCLRGPTVGLCDALALRPPPGTPSPTVCVALLGCHDSAHEVAAQFAAFSVDDAAFLSKLDAAVVKQWCWNKQMPLLGNCWLHLWDLHCLAAAEVLCAGEGGLAGALRWALGLPTVVLCRQVFETVARCLAMWRRRDKDKLAAVDLAALCPLLVDQLPDDMGVPAARALVTVFESGTAAETIAGLRPRVVGVLPELANEVRDVLRDWVDSGGLAAAPPRRPAAAVAPDPALLRRIAASRDLDDLERFCRGVSHREVQEATLRLIDLGEPGQGRLASLLTADDPPPLATVVAESVPLWADGPALDAVRRAFPAAAGAGELLFLIGLAVLERGDRAVLPPLMALCRRPTPGAWFQAAHWDRLVALGVPPAELAAELATSPHPYAYRPAVETLLSAPSGDAPPAAPAAVAAFLRCGTGRLAALRLRAAQWLHDRGDHTGFPLLLRRALAVPKPGGAPPSAEGDARLLAGAPAALVGQAVRAVLTAGPQVTGEARLLDLLRARGVDRQARDDALAALLKDAALDRTRAKVVAHLRAGESRASKLRRLAQTFAWGVVAGRELTGRIFSVEMNAGEGLGHTRFESDRVWITPLPILRGHRHAEAVVRGLIVHEFGHHLYHRDPDALTVWDEAGKAGYHGLLNLVSDEHLERNLRALDARRYGDDLKKLAAYAFQHADKEVPVATLLAAVQARALDVLTATPLAVARRRGCVAVNNGGLLAEMERAGMSFPRFVRALRMGLGNRGGDPKVAAGLALFKGGEFRRKSMAGLRDMSLQLRQIFGWETVLVESLGQDGLLAPGAGELLADAEGITDAELREAVRRLLEDRKHGRRPRPDRDGAPIRIVNQGPDESFAPITTVVPVPFDPAKHRAYAAQVAAPARQMRRYFAQLGLTMEPQRYRVQGRRVDRARVVPAGIVRGDPRLLIARQVRVRPDLFLGLLIDCSGSMQVSNRIEQGKLFGTLLAEAGRGLRGVDVRVFGFTDSVIYDAGHAGQCAAHNLEAQGGNNDAAALWHAAAAARASRRRARLLVMISDGAPTECTTSALRALVSRLTHRMNVCCAQVAVCPLEHRCFPHYVVLKEQDVIESVRQFGAVVTKLVRRAVGGSGG